jgi:hypothetical protein
MSTVQEIKAAISKLADADFREVSHAVDEMEAERFDRALEDAAQSGTLDAWLKKSMPTSTRDGRSRWMKSSTTPDFWEAYRSLRENVRNVARKTYQLWQANPNHPSLHWKQLAPGLRSVRVDLQYRALARVRGDTAYWFWIGTHNEFGQTCPAAYLRRARISKMAL